MPRSGTPGSPSAKEVLFIDMGGVIVRDEPVEARYLWSVQQALERQLPEMTPSRFFECRDSGRCTGNDAWLETLAADVLGPARWAQVKSVSWASVIADWADLAPPISGAIEAVHCLSGRYRLALAANQPKEALLILDGLGLSRCFELIALDAHLPFSKPDPRFYNWILAAVGASPGDVLMIGDRLDNDILPAAALGIETAWIRCKPDPIDVPGVPPDWLELYFASIGRFGTHNQHLWLGAEQHPRSMLEAETLSGLSAML